MRLEQLQYFVQVVESHSFNKAAQKLNITQPALTNAIRSLEEKLDVQLLVRSRRGPGGYAFMMTSKVCLPN